MSEFLSSIQSGGLTEALQQRDEPFGDYRTDHEVPGDGDTRD